MYLPAFCCDCRHWDRSRMQQMTVPDKDAKDGTMTYDIAPCKKHCPEEFLRQDPNSFMIFTKETSYCYDPAIFAYSHTAVNENPYVKKHLKETYGKRKKA